eukprot:TRINITY_DN52190_c0_g1_i1.p1 TRINITY_DN52190_c0_g1~~TRINITY_DN52190_c0_g1_i1.p1  ORF type:complete len:479 (+),score=49.90 TRINITY_DN52190_c0_g1_i1:34-1470(+)
MQADLEKILRLGNLKQEFEWDCDDIIGDGALSEVYSARRKSDNTLYAVKRIEIDLIQRRKCWKSVVHEIEILRRVNHPNCVTFVDAFRDKDYVFIVLELIEGGELLQYVTRRGKLPEKDALSLCWQLMQAVQYLHDVLGIVHRDLKPENVLVDKKTMQVKIIDFGHSKFVGKLVSRGDDALQRLPSLLEVSTPPSGVVRAHLQPGDPTPPTSHARLDSPKGTVTYMAPEILVNITKLNLAPRVTSREGIKKLDMFAIGVILYFTLSGTPPFRDAQPYAAPSKRADGLLASIQNGVDFSRKVWEPVSEDSKTLCRALLHPDPDARPNIEDAMHTKLLVDMFGPPPSWSFPSSPSSCSSPPVPAFTPSPTAQQQPQPPPPTPQDAPHHRDTASSEVPQSSLMSEDEQENESDRFTKELSIQLIDSMRTKDEDDNDDDDVVAQHTIAALQRTLVPPVTVPTLQPTLDLGALKKQGSPTSLT